MNSYVPNNREQVSHQLQYWVMYIIIIIRKNLGKKAEKDTKL